MSTSQSINLPTTAAQLRAATLAQLKPWARLINEQSTASTGTKAILRLSVNKEDLCQALANHLGIDLTAPVDSQPGATIPTLDPINEEINRRQWERVFGWAQAYLEKGEAFFDSSTPSGAFI